MPKEKKKRASNNISTYELNDIIRESSIVNTGRTKKKPSKKAKAIKKDIDDDTNDKKNMKLVVRRGTYYDPNEDFILTDGQKKAIRGEEDALLFAAITICKTKYKTLLWDSKLCRGSIDDIHLQNKSQLHRVNYCGVNRGYEDHSIDIAKGKYTRLCCEFKVDKGVISADQFIRLRNVAQQGAYAIIVTDRESYLLMLHIYLRPSLHANLLTKYDKSKYPCPIWSDKNKPVKIRVQKP